MQRLNTLWYNLLLFWVIASLASGCGNDAASKVEAMLKQQIQSGNKTITIYSLSEYPQTYRAVKTLNIYGFDPNLSTVSNPNELKSILPEDIVADLFSNKLTLPLFVLANGQVVPSETFYHAVKKLKIVSFETAIQKPYVIVYGVENCSRTSAVINDLNKKGVNYKYIDINSNAIQYTGEIEAMLNASYSKTPSSWFPPILEMDNRAWQGDDAVNKVSGM